MALSCSTQILKYATFAFNVVVFLFGLAIVIIGSVATAFLNSNYGSFLQVSHAIPVIALIVGIIIGLCGFLGCCGALQQSRLMLNIYALSLIILVVVEIILCIVLLTKKGEIYDLITKGINATFYQQFNDSNVQLIFKEMQDELECCGVNGYKDYLVAHHPSNSGCKVDDLNELKTGCAQAFYNYLQIFTFALPVAVIVIGLLQFLAAAGGCCLANAIKKDQSDVKAW
ncbi:unnamed protein product [Dibothriocephalus latus]|uniref:Tetraspanin n=1 Tax=Dibothriocephalus latus TaxID=60516 RepID=A0A3P7LGP6_DIBLA|nr:unnamed protein product [Dibothriocephalus latus]